MLLFWINFLLFSLSVSPLCKVSIKPFFSIFSCYPVQPVLSHKLPHVYFNNTLVRKTYQGQSWVRNVVNPYFGWFAMNESFSIILSHCKCDRSWSSQPCQFLLLTFSVVSLCLCNLVLLTYSYQSAKNSLWCRIYILKFFTTSNYILCSCFTKPHWRDLMVRPSTLGSRNYWNARHGSY